MTRKPEIQYVGQFYVHGSEARQLELQKEKKKARTKLPLARLQKIEKIYVDPVALGGIVVAIIMLAVMVTGALQLRDDWEEYETMSNYVSQLKRENAELTQTYRSGYDLEDIRTKALALGLVPKEELETRSVIVTVPQPEPVPNKIDQIKWFLEGLFA